MSITGTGTQADPYIITTYAELVEKAAESGVYVKVGNDINITDEYPDGDMLPLVVKSIIDGDNKTISNWYAVYTNNYNNVISVYSSGVIRNLNLRNIYAMPYSSRGFVANADSNTSSYCFENCNISGVILSGSFFHGYYCKYLMKDCSVNLLFKNTAKFIDISQAYMKDAEINNCYVKLKSESNYYLFYSNASSAPNLGSDSYYEIDQAAFGMSSSFIFSNCVFDITANSTFTFNIDSSSASPSIINTSKAPNCTPQNKLLGVTAENWLNTEYLTSIGFNAG
ncbi:MAG: hypothetical protein K6B38_02735 [Ruminococcus sp.]|nr:hypothetical protein [Ruminococcus sp.]